MKVEFYFVNGQYQIGYAVRLITETPGEKKTLIHRSIKGPFPTKNQAKEWNESIQSHLTAKTPVELHEQFRALEIPVFSKTDFKPQIAIFKEKHGDRHYLIYTKQDFEKVCLNLIKERNSYGYYSHINGVKEPIAPSYTKESISTLPVELQKEATNAWVKYEREFKWFKEATELFELKQKALNGDGSAAASFIGEMRGNEYEEYEIIEPEIV